MVSVDRDSDVVIVGSGGAALAAAFAAADAGAAVTVLERADYLGGTTAVSGGLLWVPASSHLLQAGVRDDASTALGYLQRLTAGRIPSEILRTYVDTAPAMITHLEAATPLRFSPMMSFPDYRPDIEGSLPGGRGLEVLPFGANTLGPFAQRVRISPFYTALTLSELKGGLHDASTIPWARAAERIRGNVRTLGSALVAGLLKACLDRGVQVLTGVRARRLLTDDGRVIGVSTSVVGVERAYRARRGIVLASGGFDWNARLKKDLLGSEDIAAVGVPSNEGDGLAMALEVGAALSGKHEAWWEPVSAIPGELWPEGPQMYRMNIGERSLPGSIMVDRTGRRFVNESMNYHDLSLRMFTVDPISSAYSERRAWTVFDQSFKDRYIVLTSMPGEPAPEWLPRADTLRDLARLVGADPDGLTATVARFNGFADGGIDEDFHRGENVYDRYQADPRSSPNPCLAPLARPPFYALETRLGMVGTKTGLTIDPAARVLDRQGQPIPGLYACGNLVGAAVMGGVIAGPGGTIGPAVTFGYIAGRSAAS